MIQIEELNRKWKKILRGRKIVDDRKDKSDLSDDEVFLIKKLITMKSAMGTVPTISYISKKYHVDFIGWNNEKYVDVLLCKNK